MKIDTIRIRNFRCFGEDITGEWGLVFRPKGDLNLIIGPNGSGKTALVDAIDMVMNAEGRSNQALVTEYDFPYCDTSKNLCIEVTLTEIGQALGEFESDIQWVNPEDGSPIESKQMDLDPQKHPEAVVIRFEASLDREDGEIEWHWLLPKFVSTSIDEPKELTRAQHQALGYFRIRPTVTAGAFTLGQYSALGRHLRKLRYRLGKLPKKLRSEFPLPNCSFENLECSKCPDCPDCLPAFEEFEKDPSEKKEDLTIGAMLRDIVYQAKKILGLHGWNQMNASLGPRYGGSTSSLAALTLGFQHSKSEKSFIPYERLSTGEKYSLSFALARAQVPGDLPPVILMEEPETALYPSAVGTLIGDIQALPTGKRPQIIISSHSESVLRCFTPQDVFVMGSNRQPRQLSSVIEDNKPAAGPLSRIEYLIMPGGASVLFADKVLLVEGAQDALTSGHLDRIRARTAALNSQTYHSFSSSGWCIFEAGGARNVPDCVKVLVALGKKVAALFDGDGAGKEVAESTKDLCPTFVYKSNKKSNPILEDALLFGLPKEEEENVRREFFAEAECLKCDKRETACWEIRRACGVGDRDDRKNRLQNLCMKTYSDKNLFPPAFENLLAIIDSAEKRNIHELPIENVTGG
jgi:energy-coupling factor transporter ATP-binding protein EcfA2